jgi:exonuclease SbcD
VLRHDSPMVVYSGSLQRVDFSEEGDEKGFCVVEIDPSAPQGHRMTDFAFHRVEARPFVTIDVNVPSGQADPTETVLRTISRKDIADAVVRVRISLPAEVDSQLREPDLRRALDSAHYLAAITREIEGTRRTRLEADAADGLAPMQALRLYLETRGFEPGRREKILRYARELEESE